MYTQPNRVLIMRGPSGMGKSTLAKKIAEAEKNIGVTVKIFSADDLMLDKCGNYQFDPKKLSFNHKLIFAQYCEYIGSAVINNKNENVLIIIDNTNIRKWEFVKYTIVAERLGYKVFQLSPEWITDPALLVKRANASKHGTPKETIENMLKNYEESSLPIFQTSHDL